MLVLVVALVVAGVVGAAAVEANEEAAPGAPLEEIELGVSEKARLEMLFHC